MPRPLQLLFLLLVPISLCSAANRDFEEDTLSILLPDQCVIKGTLLLPKDVARKSLIILVTPPKVMDRDLSTAIHAPNSNKFLAEKLAENGYAVFRFDNRGYGQSTGSQENVTLLTQADDVTAIALNLQGRSILAGYKIGLMGHSEGGLAALAAVGKASIFSSLTLLSTPGASGFEFFKYQFKKRLDVLVQQSGQHEFLGKFYEEQMKVFRDYYDIMESATEIDTIKKRMKVKLSADSLAGRTYTKGRGYQNFIYQWISSQQIVIRTYDAQVDLRKVKCPVLAIAGQKDDVVECESNLTTIKETLIKSGNNEVTTYSIPNVNHDLRTIQEEPVWKFVDKNEVNSQSILEKIVTWLDKGNR